MEARVKVGQLEEQIRRLKRINRAIVARIPDDYPPKRLFCDDCVQWERNEAKCGLGHKNLFFRVPTEYNDVEFGWFRRPKCRDYSGGFDV